MHLKGSAILHEAQPLPVATVILYQLKLPELDHLVAAARHKATLKRHTKGVSDNSALLRNKNQGNTSKLKPTIPILPKVSSCKYPGSLTLVLLVSEDNIFPFNGQRR